MLFRTVQVVLALVMLTALAACGTFARRPIERPVYYDVRDVAVVAGGGVPQQIVAGIDRRIADAIVATLRPVSLPRVILTVQVTDYRSRGYFNNGRPTLTFRVVATSVDSGVDIAAGSYTVTSVTDMPGYAEESVAEEVAARVRDAFSLQIPRAVQPYPYAATTPQQLMSPAMPGQPYRASAGPLRPASGYGERPLVAAPGYGQPAGGYGMRPPAQPYGVYRQPTPSSVTALPRGAAGAREGMGGERRRGAQGGEVLPDASATPDGAPRNEPARRPSPANPVRPVTTIMPPAGKPVDPVPQPRPFRSEDNKPEPAKGAPAAPAAAKRVGTNVEQGAQGAIRLPGPLGACDPNTDNECLAQPDNP